MSCALKERKSGEEGRIVKGQSNISKLTLSYFLLVEGERIQKSLSDPGSVSLTHHIFKLFCKIGQTFCILYKITFNTIL